MTALATAAGKSGPRRQGLAGTAASIAILNVMISVIAVVSSPLQARALGAGGRGDLAAIVVPLWVIPVLADLGLPIFITTAVSKGRSVAALLGSVGPIYLGTGVLLALAGPFIADIIAGGRRTVELFLILGFALTPLIFAFRLLEAVNFGREGWRVWLVVRAIPPVGTLLGTLVLFMLDALTVSTAAIMFISMTLLAGLPVLVTVRWKGRPRFEREVALEGLRFGSRAWLATFASMANTRLDQLVMTRAVSSEQLGLYAVAVNVSSLQQTVSGSVSTAIYPRVSAGAGGLMARACRVTIWLVSAVSGVLMIAVGFLLPWLFGSDFSGAVDMTRILLLSAMASAGTLVLGSGITASGMPGVAARGELLSVVITVAGLLLVLEPLGAIGAALVSLVAYTVTFLYLLNRAVRLLGGRYRDYLVPHRDDASFVLGLPAVARAAGKLRRLRQLGDPSG